MKKRYSVQEIDDLRKEVGTIILIEIGHGPTYKVGMGRNNVLNQPEIDAFWEMHARRVEDRMRTHMMAGHTAADIKATQPKRWNP